MSKTEVTKKFQARNVFHGTHGYFLWNGVPVMEASKFSIKIKTDREDMQFCNEMMKDTKLTALGGEWSATLRKVYSRAREIAEAFKRGEDVRVSFVGTLCDPDALGQEKITISNCWFNDLSMMDWEVGKLVEEEYSGGFTDFDYNDSVATPAN